MRPGQKISASLSFDERGVLNHNELVLSKNLATSFHSTADWTLVAAEGSCTLENRPE